MLISKNASKTLSEAISSQEKTYCSGLFLSARWFVVSQVAESGTHVIIMPDKESAEYCSADLYSLVEGDRVFFDLIEKNEPFFSLKLVYKGELMF